MDGAGRRFRPEADAGLFNTRKVDEQPGSHDAGGLGACLGEKTRPWEAVALDRAADRRPQAGRDGWLWAARLKGAEPFRGGAMGVCWRGGTLRPAGMGARPVKLRSLTQLECQVSLESNRLACLACSKDDVPYVVPIYYAYEDKEIYSFSLLGKKIEWMRTNPSVCVLVEIHLDKGVWKSVVAEGRYEELPSAEGSGQERERAWRLLSRSPVWWEPGAYKLEPPPVSDRSAHIFYRIHVGSCSGREMIS